MITKAKVNAEAVKIFYKNVNIIKDFSSQFAKGTECIEEIIVNLKRMMKELEEKESDMISASEKLETKIVGIEHEIAKLQSEINELETELSKLEEELTSTKKYVEIQDEDGTVYMELNPSYELLMEQISDKENEISVVRSDIGDCMQRRDRATTIKGHLLLHIDKTKNTIAILNDKAELCRVYIERLEKIRKSNQMKSTNAADGLKKIQDIINAYLKVKMRYMQYDFLKSTDNSVNININFDVNFNQNIHENNVSQQNDDIVKHGIKFDAMGHICEFDGKKFGGKYNSYKNRLDKTSKDSIFGNYIGDRGESRYIPSNMTAEGIAVIEILSEYNTDGIEYRNAEPDFEICADDFVCIDEMTSNRGDFIDSLGIRRQGNFSQADIELAKKWNAEFRDNRSNWIPRDVYNYRRDNGLTWHEKCDMKTMVLVKKEINDYFKHIGGCSECRIRDNENMGGEFDE